MNSHFSRSDPAPLLRNMQSAWSRIAHERVQERLEGIFLRLTVPFLGVSRGTSGDLYEKFSEQAKRSRYSKVVSRELEDALLALESNIVKKALGIYEDEGPERPIKSNDLLWAIYNFGLVPFIQTEVLRDVSFKLANAQPALGIDVFRLDAERFFTYNSAGLRKQLPVVIRVVDELKRRWYDEIRERSRITNSQSVAVSTGGPSDHQAQSAGTTPKTVQLTPEPRTKQCSPGPVLETTPPIRAGNQTTNAGAEIGASNLAPSLELPRTAAAAKRESKRTATSSSSTAASKPLKWEDIGILFLSDDRIQIYIRNKASESFNYAGFGFMNQTTKGSNSAWLALRKFAELKGAVRTELEAKCEWRKFEKRVQEIRGVLRKHFEISSDPIPFIEGNG